MNSEVPLRQLSLHQEIPPLNILGAHLGLKTLVTQVWGTVCKAVSLRLLVQLAGNSTQESPPPSNVNSPNLRKGPPGSPMFLLSKPCKLYELSELCGLYELHGTHKSYELPKPSQFP